jgi:hypothetical protein
MSTHRRFVVTLFIFFHESLFLPIISSVMRIFTGSFIVLIEVGMKIGEQIVGRLVSLCRIFFQAP